MNDDAHVLVVPEDPDVTMEIAHPRTCRQGRKSLLVRDETGAPACQYERLLLERAPDGGLDGMFRRTLAADSFFPDTTFVQPGRHPVTLVDGELRLAGRGVAA